MSSTPLSEDEYERPFDLTKALEEFGIGFGNDDDLSDAEPTIEPNLVPQAEWASIGLRPGWQQLQITLRDASFQIMAGFSRKPHAEPPIDNDNASEEKNEDDDKNKDEENDGDEDDNDVELESEDEIEGIGRFPTFDRLKFTLQNAPEIISGPGRLTRAFRRSSAAADGPRASGAVSSNADVALAAVSADLDMADVNAGASSTTTEADAVNDANAEEAADSDDELGGHEFGHEFDEQEADAEIEEIGRFPTLQQLQFTLRNASEIIAHAGPFTYGKTPEFKPVDLLAKWAYPGSASLGWQNLMPHFTFPALPTFPGLLQLPALPLPALPALPSFLGDESDEEEDDVDEDVLLELCDTTGLSEEDFVMDHNAEGLTGCEHYLRNCKVECAHCRRFYTCRLCHNEQEHEHEMEAHATRRMLCMNCLKPQPARRKCRFCKEVMGDYYCGECRLWNDDPEKPIYHCAKCGICRVGRGIGIDVFHCDTCGICMSLTVENNHRCIERAANSGCPICLDDLFSSTNPVVFMPCGHPIHKDCFTEYSKRYYRCPVCAKSILNTSALFRMIDEEVRSEVLPPELACKRVSILCQDCRLKSHTDFHLAGLKCGTCGSYNTAQL